MAIIRPFRALRPKPRLAKHVASRPYDVLNSTEARLEASGNPDSFLHITKSEIDLPETVDSHSQEVYDKAKENLIAFEKQEILFREEKPCYYIYMLTMNGKSQTGLVCLSSLDDYEQDIIRKHETTRPDKELDRINHILTTRAQTGNVFLAYKTDQRIHQAVEDWKASHHPDYDFTADDGVKHLVWVIHDEESMNRLTTWFGDHIPFTYIADGHHRAASADKVRAALGKKGPESAAFFLTTLFPSDQLNILDYNRLVKDLMNDMTADGFLKALETDFLVGKMDKAFSPAQLHEFGMYLNGSWYKLVAKENTYSKDPIGVLDVSILQSNVLDKILAINDPRTDKRIDFVGGIRGLQELEKKVDSGEMKIAFSLHPVTIQQLFDIADSGGYMPPKSTWFEPKLRDGLLTHLID
ncbi:MAG: DUF1015 domain-containing protein [Chitinophagales bacterium]